jgi:hypothetical protein
MKPLTRYRLQVWALLTHELRGTHHTLKGVSPSRKVILSFFIISAWYFFIGGRRFIGNTYTSIWSLLRLSDRCEWFANEDVLTRTSRFVVLVLWSERPSSAAHAYLLVPDDLTNMDWWNQSVNISDSLFLWSLYNTYISVSWNMQSIES